MMGGSASVFTEDELQIYEELTDLTSAEIEHAYKRFKEIDPLGGFSKCKKGNIPFSVVAESLKELKVNPFRYRICQLFCPCENGMMNFDDFLGMVSIFSPKCKASKKIEWAFKLFDFNDDDSIDYGDLQVVLDILTGRSMEDEFKDTLVNVVLKEVDTDNDNAISFSEFERILAFEIEFYKSFSFTI